VTTSRDVGIGFIGSGFARRVQLPALALVPGVRRPRSPVATAPTRKRWAREFGLPHVFTDGTELARSADVDLVIVSSTPDTHADMRSRHSKPGSTCCAKNDGHRRV